MEGNKTTARRSRRGASVRAAVAEPAKAPVKARAKAPAKDSARVKATKPKPAVRTDVETSLTESDRLRMIELAAFFRAERRGFVPGYRGRGLVRRRSRDCGADSGRAGRQAGSQGAQAGELTLSQPAPGRPSRMVT